MIDLTGYKPAHFDLRELVPQYMWLKYSPDRLWRMLDTRMLWTLDRLRELYGVIYVNNWHWSGNNQFGCLRPFDCAVGAALSDHKFGRAADPKFRDVSAEDVRQDVLADPFREEFQFITSIELEVPWLHFGVGSHNKQQLGILQITPN